MNINKDLIKDVLTFLSAVTLISSLGVHFMVNQNSILTSVLIGLATFVILMGLAKAIDIRMEEYK